MKASSETPLRSAVYREAERYLLWHGCADCGGVSLPLHAQSQSAAEEEGAVLSGALEAGGCPGCRAQSERSLGQDGGTRAFFDPEQGWQLLVSFPGGSALLPLEIHEITAREQATASARELLDSFGQALCKPGGGALIEDGEASYLSLDCHSCGQVKLPLEPHGLIDDQSRNARALLLFDQIAAGGCPGCVTRRIREQGADGEELYWDTIAGEWHAAWALEGEPSLLVPLGVYDPLALAAAQSAWLSLRIGSDELIPELDCPGDERAGVLRCGSSWELWVPCPDCGGHTLSLELEPGSDLRSARRAAAGVLRALDGECLGCHSLDLRAQSADARTRMSWYDTGLGDWVLYEPFGNGGGGVLLPLGIGKLAAGDEDLAAAEASLRAAFE